MLQYGSRQRRRPAISPHDNTRSILIVDASPAYRDLLRQMVDGDSLIDAVSDFPSAYARLSTGPPDLLVTNLRLHATVEGLQLAYIVASGRYPTRTIVYADRFDGIEPWVAHEIQRIGAFFEGQKRLLFALPSYAQATMPVLDRRNPRRPDRRLSYRGGRRASDVPLTTMRAAEWSES